MGVYLLDSLENLPILSYHGRLIEKSSSIEKFCKCCKKKFYVDTKPNFFMILDTYGIKQSLKGGICSKFCGDCTLDFIENNHTLNEFF